MPRLSNSRRLSTPPDAPNDRLDSPTAPLLNLPPRTAEPLLWLGGGGHEFRTGPHYYFNAANRPDRSHQVLQLTLAGTGFYRPPGQPRTLLPTGTAFLAEIPGPFEYGWHANGPLGAYEQIFLSFEGDVARRWCDRIRAQHGPILSLGDDRTVGDTMLAVLSAAHTGMLYDRYLVSSQLYGLLMLLLSVLSRSRAQGSPLAAQALITIESSAPDSTFNITQLARSLDCSREHLAREFRRTSGISPLEYLTQHRIRLAAAELRGSPAKLTTIAKRSGFSSAGYLCRIFHRTVGVTPQQFRDRPWLVAP